MRRESGREPEAVAPPNYSYTRLLVNTRYDNVSAQSREGYMCMRLRL